MKRYNVEHQNYSIFKVENNHDQPYVHFFWGKFDFRMSFEVTPDGMEQQQSGTIFNGEGRLYRPARFELLHHFHWYRFVKPTAHGMVLEETLWMRQEMKHHVELPKDLFAVCVNFCAEELGFQKTGSQAA